MTSYRKYKRKDGKPAAPKKQKMGLSSKRRGADFELRIAKLYRKHGWYVQHNTKGLYDLVCIPAFDKPNYNIPYPFDSLVPHMLQPTLEKYPPKDKIQNLIDNDDKWDGIAYLVQRQPKTWKLIFTLIADLK